MLMLDQSFKSLSLSRNLFCSSSLLGIALMAASPAAAQEAPKAAVPDKVTDIVVTAQRREQKLMDVPVAVSAISGAALASAGITSPREIVRVLPGITMNDGGPNQSFAIRGVSLNDAGDSNESPIAYYQNDVYVAALGGVQSQMFDISRVEVLRGPQGTLFGRNATGVVVQFISNKPTTTLSGDLSLKYGSYNQVIATGAVGGPIGAGNIRFRTSFNYNRDDGWQYNVVTNTRTAKTNEWAIRQLIDIDVTSNLKLELNGHIGSNNDVAAVYGIRGAYNSSSGTFDPSTYVATGSFCSQAQVVALAPQCTTYYGFRDPDPKPTRVYSSQAAAPVELRNHGASGALTYNGTGFTVTSISAYEYTKKSYFEDSIPNPQPETPSLWGATRAQLSQELRISGQSGPLHWTAGAFYFNEHLTDGYFISVVLAPIFGTLGSNNDFEQRTSAGAAYAQGDYKITSNLTFTGGLRYSLETKTLHITDSLTAPSYEEDDKSKNNAATWKLGLSWQLTPDVLTYASASTGFKSAGFNTTAVGPGASAPSAPEHITTYEVGVKASLFDRRLQATGSVYYNHYKDFQLVDDLPGAAFPVLRLINIPLARIYGAEVDLLARPFDKLYIDLNGTYTTSKIYAPGIYSGDLLLDGLSVTNTPKRTVKGSIEYHIDSDKFGQFIPRASFSSQSSFAPELSCYESYSCIVPAYTLANASITCSPPGKAYHIEISAENLFNKAYENGSYFFGDGNALIWGRPRWLGIRFYTHW